MSYIKDLERNRYEDEELKATKTIVEKRFELMKTVVADRKLLRVEQLQLSDQLASEKDNRIYYSLALQENRRQMLDNATRAFALLHGTSIAWWKDREDELGGEFGNLLSAWKEIGW